MNIKDIEKLAALSRIDLLDSEKESLLNDMDSILAYVDQVKEATAMARETATASTSLSRNVWREDGEPHESGIFTEVLLASSPERHGGPASTRGLSPASPNRGESTRGGYFKVK